MCVCVRACVCSCMFVFASECLFVCLSTNVHVCVCACVCAGLCLCVFSCERASMYVYVNVFAHMLPIVHIASGGREDALSSDSSAF